MIRFALCVLLLTTSAALAHDERKFSDWIGEGGYTNPSGGGLCCGFNDCLVVTGVVTTTLPASGYRLPSGEFVPADEATPSEDDNFYRCHDYDGRRRCFFFPSPKTTRLW